MRKGYDYLIISFVAVVISSFASKIGATTLDKLLFIFISYGLGVMITLVGHIPNRKNIDKHVRSTSRKFGIILGIINFSAFFTLLSALSTGPGALVFPLLGLNVAFIVLFSIILFKERLNLRGIVGFILAIVAMLLLR